MKTYEQEQLDKRPGFVIAMISRIPEGEDEHSDYPVNVTNDIDDSGTVDEGAQSDIDRAVRGYTHPLPDKDDEELSTPYDSENIHTDDKTLDDADNLMGGDSEIDDETTI